MLLELGVIVTGGTWDCVRPDTWVWVCRFGKKTTHRVQMNSFDASEDSCVTTRVSLVHTCSSEDDRRLIKLWSMRLQQTWGARSEQIWHTVSYDCSEKTFLGTNSNGAMSSASQLEKANMYTTKVHKHQCSCSDPKPEALFENRLKCWQFPPCAKKQRPRDSFQWLKCLLSPKSLSPGNLIVSLYRVLLKYFPETTRKDFCLGPFHETRQSPPLLCGS